jgi:hypothetical protein
VFEKSDRVFKKTNLAWEEAAIASNLDSGRSGWGESAGRAIAPAYKTKKNRNKF